MLMSIPSNYISITVELYMHTLLNTNSCHSLILLLFKVLRRDIFKGLVLRTEAMISLFHLTIVYNDGYLPQNNLFPIHLSFQSLICSPLLNLKHANHRKHSFIFIKPDQKCESPTFLTTLPIVWLLSDSTKPDSLVCQIGGSGFSCFK
jgi:hypothetical protein